MAKKRADGKHPPETDQLVCGVPVEVWDALGIQPPYRPGTAWSSEAVRMLADATAPLTELKDIEAQLPSWDADARQLPLEATPAFWAAQIRYLDEFVNGGRVRWPFWEFHGREAKFKRAEQRDVEGLRSSLVSRLKQGERLVREAEASTTPPGGGSSGTIAAKEARSKTKPGRGPRGSTWTRMRTAVALLEAEEELFAGGKAELAAALSTRLDLKAADPVKALDRAAGYYDDGGEGNAVRLRLYKKALKGRKKG